MFVNGPCYQAPAEHQLLSRSACSFENPWALSQAKEKDGSPHRCKTRQRSSVTFSGYVSTTDHSSKCWHSIPPRSSSSVLDEADSLPSSNLPPHTLMDHNNLQDLRYPSAATGSVEMRSYPPLAAKQSHPQTTTSSGSLQNAWNWKASGAFAGNTIRQAAFPQTRPNATLMTRAGLQDSQHIFHPSNAQWGCHRAPNAHRATDLSLIGPLEQQQSNAQYKTFENNMLNSRAGIDGNNYSYLGDFSFTALESAMPFQPQLLDGYDETSFYPLSPPPNKNDHVWQSTPKAGVATSDLKRKRQPLEQSPSILTPAPSQHDGSPMAGSLQPSLTRFQGPSVQPVTQSAPAWVANLDQMLPTAGLEFDDEFSAPFDLSGLLDRPYESIRDVSLMERANEGLNNGTIIQTDTAAQDGANIFRSSPKASQSARANQPISQRDLDPCLLDAEGTALRDFVVQSRNNGVPYRQITADLRVKYQIDIAESTVRGKHRTWTIPKEQRARKPEWSDHAIQCLFEAVGHFLRERDSCHHSYGPARNSSRIQKRMQLPWQRIAERMRDNGCQKYGNATVKKKYTADLGGQDDGATHAEVVQNWMHHSGWSWGHTDR